MKSITDYLDSYMANTEEVNDPNKLMSEFFTMGDVAEFREDIYHIVRTACSGKYWKKGSPNDLIFLFRNLEFVINAAHIINGQARKSALHIEDKDIFNPDLFRRNDTISNNWDYFPRMLSYKEFVNPYTTFKIFFKYQDHAHWKKTLRNVLEYALSRGRIFDEWEDFDCLAIYRHLVKLIEAAYLICVRENIPTDRYIKLELPGKEG